MNIEEQLSRISLGTEQVTPLDALKKKLEKNQPLRIKLGMDPTSPDLHLGHAVVLQKLRTFQDLGHEVVFLIGDFTARIGDPSGRSKTRPPLSDEEIAKNSATYFEQVEKILDREKTKVFYNSEWLKELSLADTINIAGKTTVARIIEREDFATRLKEGVSIGLHELFYPLLQGYDSVQLLSDVEIGGTDQTFNLFMGRHLQEQMNVEPQVILTMPILEGLDGVQKMSKSLGNYIGLCEPASDAYGKIMSISDELMLRYYALLLEKSADEIKAMQDAGTHPMQLKKDLAHGVVSRFWSAAEADTAAEQFTSLFQEHDYSKAKEVPLPSTGPMWVVDLLKEIGAIATSSEAKRLISEGAVSIDGQKIDDFKAEIVCNAGMIVKVGKHRIYKLA